MSYCLNPACQHPENSDELKSCRSCGKKLSPLRNRYHIIRPLGGGGFGRTFLAEDRDKLNELCVVKQLVPQLQGTSAQNKATQLFGQEAQRLQQLGEHPQIPALYAYFAEDDYLYLVQQLIVGQSLREQLNLGTVCRFITCIAIYPRSSSNSPRYQARQYYAPSERSPFNID
jgi:serine/threonine protein kinase